MPRNAPAKGRPKPAARRRLTLRLLRLALGAVLLYVAFNAAVVLLYRLVDPPLTPLMVIRWFEGHGVDRTWVPLSAISLHLQRAVIASEDNTFCQHYGYDVDAVSEQIDNLLEGEAARGGSSITNQTAKNILLWPAGSFLRKALEVTPTLMIEAFWPKRRILEVYLNIAETGPGLYGAEAAAQAYFGRSAAHLTRRQAALIATALPAPRARRPARPGPGHARLARRIERRTAQLGTSYYACLGDDD